MTNVTTYFVHFLEKGRELPETFKYPTKHEALEAAQTLISAGATDVLVQQAIVKEIPVPTPPSKIENDRARFIWEMQQLETEYNGLRKLATRPERCRDEGTKLLERAEAAAVDPEVIRAKARREAIATEMATLQDQYLAAS